MSFSAENHHRSVPMNQTTEVRDKGTRTVEQLGSASPIATGCCLCVPLIILGSVCLQLMPSEIKCTCLVPCRVRAWLIWFPFYPLPYTCYCTNRWHGPHTLASKDRKSDVAICLRNCQMTALLCRGGVAWPKKGKLPERVSIYTFPSSLPLSSTQGES